jgi:hypothetical protein
MGLGLSMMGLFPSTSDSPPTRDSRGEPLSQVSAAQEVGEVEVCPMGAEEPRAPPHLRRPARAERAEVYKRGWQDRG